jgi:hypothetical protein
MFEDEADSFETLSWEGDLEDLGRLLYGENNPHQDHRLAYLINPADRHLNDKARINCKVKEIAFSTVYDALENDDYRALTETEVTTSNFYGEEINPQKLAEDVIQQLDKYGVGGKAAPPEGYEVTVSNPEGDIE